MCNILYNNGLLKAVVQGKRNYSSWALVTGKHSFFSYTPLKNVKSSIRKAEFRLILREMAKRKAILGSYFQHFPKFGLFLCLSPLFRGNFAYFENYKLRFSVQISNAPSWDH